MCFEETKIFYCFNCCTHWFWLGRCFLGWGCWFFWRWGGRFGWRGGLPWGRGWFFGRRCRFFGWWSGLLGGWDRSSRPGSRFFFLGHHVRSDGHGGKHGLATFLLLLLQQLEYSRQRQVIELGLELVEVHAAEIINDIQNLKW